MARRFCSRLPARGLHRRRQTEFGRRARKGGNWPSVWRGKTSTEKEGFLRALLFLWNFSARFFAVVHLHNLLKAAYLGPSRPASAAAHGICHRNAAGTAATSPAGGSTRTDPDVAFRADGLCRLDRGHSPARAAAAGTGELDHRCLRVHSEAL